MRNIANPENLTGSTITTDELALVRQHRGSHNHPGIASFGKFKSSTVICFSMFHRSAGSILIRPVIHLAPQKRVSKGGFRLLRTHRDRQTVPCVRKFPFIGLSPSYRRCLLQEMLDRGQQTGYFPLWQGMIAGPSSVIRIALDFC